MKEYSAPLGWTLPIVAIGLYNIRNAGSTIGSSAGAVALLSFLGLVVLVWLTVGWLKKTRSLGVDSRLYRFARTRPRMTRKSPKRSCT